MKLTIKQKTFLTTILITLFIGNISYFYTSSEVKSLSQKEIFQQLQATSNLGYEFIDAKYPGEWLIKNDQLYKGGYKVNLDHSTVDLLKSKTSNEFTIFMNDTRVATTVTKDGFRFVNTKCSQEVKDAVLIRGETYQGQTEIAGKPYETLYKPIKNKSGDIIGMWFTGVTKENAVAITS